MEPRLAPFRAPIWGPSWNLEFVIHDGTALKGSRDGEQQLAAHRPLPLRYARYPFSLLMLDIDLKQFTTIGSAATV
jgi:hypothetical protein